MNRLNTHLLLALLPLTYVELLITAYTVSTIKMTRHPYFTGDCEGFSFLKLCQLDLLCSPNGEAYSRRFVRLSGALPGK